MKDKNAVIGLWARSASIIIFFGAIWGICEATLGFILHQSLAPFTGMILFPIGYIMMRMAQSSIRSKSEKDMHDGNHTVLKMTPMLVACVAASIKLVDLFIPGAMVIQVINPAMAILMEGLLLAMVMPVMTEMGDITATRKDPITFRRVAAGAFAASFGWRIIYVLMLTLESSFGLKIRLFKAGTEAVISFLTVDALINGALIVLIAMVMDKLNDHGTVRFKPHPIISSTVLMMAIMVTLWIN